MKTFSEFLTEAMESNGSDELKRDAQAMWKALVFKRTDSDQDVYNTLHTIDGFFKGNDLHEKWTLKGVQVLREFSNSMNVFDILEEAFEISEKKARNWDSDEDPLTIEQAR